MLLWITLPGHPTTSGLTDGNNRGTTSITPLASDMPHCLKFANWNIQSLQPSLDQVKRTLNDPKEASVLGFTETWLNKDVSDTEVQIPGYKLVARSDRVHNTWGEVAMYVNESLPCDERDDLRHKDLEAIWIQITYPSSPPILGGHCIPTTRLPSKMV